MLPLLVISIFILQPIETHFIASKNSKLPLNIKQRKILALCLFFIGLLLASVQFFKSIDNNYTSIVISTYQQKFGLEVNATNQQVSKAFRKLKISKHPDRNPSPDANQQFQKIFKGIQNYTEHIEIDYEDLKTQSQRDIINRLGSISEQFNSNNSDGQSFDPRFLFPLLDYMPWCLIIFVYLDQQVRNIKSLIYTNQRKWAKKILLTLFTILCIYQISMKRNGSFNYLEFLQMTIYDQVFNLSYCQCVYETQCLLLHNILPLLYNLIVTYNDIQTRPLLEQNIENLQHTAKNLRLVSSNMVQKLMDEGLAHIGQEIELMTKCLILQNGKIKQKIQEKPSKLKKCISITLLILFIAPMISSFLGMRSNGSGNDL